MAHVEEYSIVRGPSKFDLMISLFNGNGSNRIPVDLELEHRGDASKYKFILRVNIESIEREDGSGESWNFTASSARDSLRPPGFKQDEKGWTRISGYYSTKNRTGYLKYSLEQPKEFDSAKF
jgi:hypothetical protein